MKNMNENCPDLPEFKGLPKMDASAKLEVPKLALDPFKESKCKKKDYTMKKKDYNNDMEYYNHKMKKGYKNNEMFC